LGLADPMEKVLVEASWGAGSEVVAGADGKWQVYLKTPKAGGPYQIEISGKIKLY